jgi:DNA-binding IclR family transcriptional regulator
MLLSIGGTIPLHVGALGRLCLAYEPKSSFEAYVAKVEFSSYTRTRTRTTPNTKEWLAAELEQIRGAGYAVSDEDVIPGINGSRRADLGLR